MSDSAATPTGDGFLDPMTRALTGLVLAVVGLMGPQLLGTAVQLLTEGQFGGAPSTYLFWMAVGASVPLGLAMGLALPVARTATGGWVRSLARTAVLVAGVGLVGAVLLLVGALLDF